MCFDEVELGGEFAFLRFELFEAFEHGCAVAAFGDGGCDVADGAAEGVDLLLEVFADGFIFCGLIGILLLGGCDEGLEIGRVIEEFRELGDDFFFDGFGGDGWKVTVSSAGAAGAGVAEVIGAVSLA